MSKQKVFGFKTKKELDALVEGIQFAENPNIEIKNIEKNKSNGLWEIIVIDHGLFPKLDLIDFRHVQ